MPKIILTRRSNDWHACLASDPGMWDCGRTKAEALGKLLLMLHSFGLCEIELVCSPYDLLLK
jgi:hypothetical protein